jgi:Na+/H+ antiporter NhaD/arsenite permease-like protein
MSPAAARAWDDWQTVAALVLFAGTYFVIAVGKLPGYRLDRAGAALLGAALMVGLGVLPLDAAYRAIDFDTITLLLGMMILVANLKLSGFFRLVNGWIMGRARHPLVLLVAVVLVCGFFSAFLVNDTICLIMTPIVAELVLSLKRNPVPYLLAIPMASNVGSTATITGNPQNMIIGSLSQIPYGSFAAALSPVAAIGLVLTVLLIAAIYRDEFLGRAVLERPAPRPARYHGPLVIKSVLIAIAMMTLFFAGLPVAGVAIVGGALLLFTRRVKADKVYFEIDWSLLLMFVGLFVVVAGLEHGVLTPEAAIAIGRLHLQSAPVLGDADGGPVERGQQRTGGAGPETVRGGPAGPAARLAAGRHGLDARRQSHVGRIGGQSHRGAARAAIRRRYRLLALFPGRRAAHVFDDPVRPVVAVMLAIYVSRTSERQARGTTRDPLSVNSVARMERSEIRDRRSRIPLRSMRATTLLISRR